jgi:hypothetical protein
MAPAIMDVPAADAAAPGWRASGGPEAAMSEFYGIETGTIPEFAEVGGGKFMSVQSLPEHTVRHMLMFMEQLRGMYQADPLAFEVCVRHVATMIEDQRRGEGSTDPRGDPAA